MCNQAASGTVFSEVNKQCVSRNEGSLHRTDTQVLTRHLAFPQFSDVQVSIFKKAQYNLDLTLLPVQSTKQPYSLELSFSKRAKAAS